MFGNNSNDQPQDNGTDFASSSPTDPDTSSSLNLPAPASASSAPSPSSSDGSSAMDDTVNPALPSSSPTEDSQSSSNKDDLLDNKDSDLLDIKQKALQHLSPLVDHLDQSPEEKFRTLMMMIQASDDQSLLGEAYEAAEKISDEKERAQALLDVVNEINYFTQQKED